MLEFSRVPAVMLEAVECLLAGVGNPGRKANSPSFFSLHKYIGSVPLPLVQPVHELVTLAYASCPLWPPIFVNIQRRAPA